MSKQGFFDEHWTDENGNPAGGVSTGKGFTVSWQNGPLGRFGTEERREPNGAFVEDVLDACRSRFEFYQTASNGKFACEENAACIELLEQVLEIQALRTQRRIQSKTEGTHEGN